jgi:hypothetical protein
MRPEQAKLAHAMLATSVSQVGYIKATTIMSLEQILKDREAGGRGNLVRDPDGYFFSVFGEPSESGTWGFKVEGHHVALNFTISNGKVISDNPAFMGADPAEVKDGPRSGLRVLGREEDLGRQLVQSLDEQQKTVAVVTTTPRDILTGEIVLIDMLETFDIRKPTGIPASKLNAKQMETLSALIEEYAYRMPLELADVTMSEIRKPNLNNVYFTWAGGLNRGDLHYYRVHGPSFLIEFNNTQGGGNHVHSVWRDLKNDFGGDLLKEHLRTAHAN